MVLFLLYFLHVLHNVKIVIVSWLEFHYPLIICIYIVFVLLCVGLLAGFAFLSGTSMGPLLEAVIDIEPRWVWLLLPLHIYCYYF